MHKLLLNLDDYRSHELDLLSLNEKTSKTSLIKEAIDLLLKTRNVTKNSDELDIYFGAWSNKKFNNIKIPYAL